jgi:hypothetical protein
MDPLTSTVLAILALVVSLGSTMAAIWAVQQTRVYRPQARWEPVWPSSRSTQAAARTPMEVRLINHGSSTAYRVKLTVDTVIVDAASAPARYERNEWSVAPGGALGLVVPLTRATASFDATKKSWSYVAIDETPVRPRLTVTWFEGSTSRQRSATFRYPE